MKKNFTRMAAILVIMTAILFNSQQTTAQCDLIVFANPATNASCPGDNDGSVNAVGVFGTPPYTVVWTLGGVTVQTNNNVPQGVNSTLNNAIGGATYTATFTDATGACSNFANVTTGTDFAICADTRVLDAYCGRSLPHYNTYIKCYTVNNGDFYEFRFRNSAIGYDETIQGTTNNPRITSMVFLSNPPPHNTTYNVTVRASVGGVFGPFGDVCQISTPPVATTRVYLGYCGTTLAAVNTTIKAYAVAGATSYEWRFVNSATGFDQTITSSTNRTSLWYLPGVSPNTTYDVTVRAIAGSQSSAFSDVCKLTSPANVTSFLSAQEDGSEAYLGENRSSVQFTGNAEDAAIALEPAVTMYPNPNNGTEMRLAIDNLGEGIHNARLQVFNLAGQEVHTQNFSRQGTYIDGVCTFDQTLQSGMYLVRVSIGEYTFTDKLVVK